MMDSLDTLREFNSNWESLKYWINPVHWFKELHEWLAVVINHEDTATVLMASTIVGVWLIMVNVKWAKKVLFWGWVIYWVLRGFVYPNSTVAFG